MVSVGVITYNSSDYVIETLESIRLQTYQNIELIISDDASTDNTIEICREWLNLNHQRFADTKLIAVHENTGLPANQNRCIKAASGDWLKLIAGDDILLPNCISENMQYVMKNKKANVIFSQVKVYQNEFKEVQYQKDDPKTFPTNLMHPLFTSEDQFNLLILSDRITYTPSCFINKKAILKVGGYDETFQVVEDYPMWLKLTQSGEKLHYFHKPTVGYRVHSKAINNTGNKVLFKPSQIYNFVARKKYAHPYLPWTRIAKETWTYRVSCIFQSLAWNKNTFFMRSWYMLWSVYLNPFVYLDAIRRKFNKK